MCARGGLFYAHLPAQLTIPAPMRPPTPPIPFPPHTANPTHPVTALIPPPPRVTDQTLTAATAVRTNFEEHHLSNQSELGHAGLRA